jgi:hypothetical protein
MPFRNALTKAKWLTGRARPVVHLLLCAKLAGAQAIAGSGGFSIPNAALFCRSIPAGPADSAAFVFEYVDDDAERQRLSLVAFDFGGVPLYMMVSAQKTTSTGESRTDAVAVRFVPKAMGGRVTLPRGLPAEVPMNGGSGSLAHEKPVEEALTGAELGQAKALAEWFWSHRCKGLADDP